MSLTKGKRTAVLEELLSDYFTGFESFWQTLLQVRNEGHQTKFF